MKKWSNTFTKDNIIYSNAAISIYLANTDTVARVYDKDGNLLYNAPQGYTDNNGYIEFYFDPDEYSSGQLFDIICVPNGVCNPDEAIRYRSQITFEANDVKNIDGKPASGFSTVVDDGASPEDPNGLTASEGIQAVFLKWNKNPEGDVSHYEIWRNTSNDNSTASLIAIIKGTMYWDSGLTAGTTYYYWLKTVDHLGNISNFNAIDGVLATPHNVDTSDIADAAVVTGKLADLAVEAAKLANSSVTAEKIANLAVGTAAIANAAISTAKIADLAVTNAKIYNLDAAKITTGTLDADRIAANSITADKINVNNLSAISTTTGSLTAENGSTLDIHGNLYLENDSNFYFYDDGNWIAYIGLNNNTFTVATSGNLTIDSGGELLFDNTLTPKDAYDIGTLANPWQNLHLNGDLYLHGNVHDPANIFPQGDGAYSNGTTDHRWYEVCTVNLHTGDILFSDTHCPICGRRFKKWDILALKVIKYIKDKKGDEIDCVPVHMQCLKIE